ncbi:TRAF3-interacting protein 1-like isoform X2 [Dreissena polymorpha]|uniref:TRAF3-interacting protein 1-like isoform X2 n=1 Tax=Dreissena polymorpha TaxID=45954 RepID=UPI0022655B65|nr:TRAF3-interacting protein 1-like isoform X2 [Dreissena polymorpha]
MDPKIAKKTQDSLGKFIKKPPLTEKLLSKPPFRFLHDVMTSVIKTTGVMKGLYTDSEMNSENVKDKDSKIAFLQKAVDYVSNASGKTLSVKPAKVVAGHEPEKTNEFLQALAAAIGSKVDNDSVVDAVNNKGGKPSSSKEEKKEEKEATPKEPERQKSSDRQKKDDAPQEKRSRDRADERNKDRDDKRRDKDDKQRDRDDKRRGSEDKHKDRDDKPKERDAKPKDRDDKQKERDDKQKDRDDKSMDRERESRQKSGRSRPTEEELIDLEHKISKNLNDIDSDILLSNEFDESMDIGDATFAVENPKQVFADDETPLRPIPRKFSTYNQLVQDTNLAEISGSENNKVVHEPINIPDENFEIPDNPVEDVNIKKGKKSARPKGARRRKRKNDEFVNTVVIPQVTDDTNTPYVSATNSPVPVADDIAIPSVESKSGNSIYNPEQSKSAESPVELESDDVGFKEAKNKGPLTSTPKGSPVSPKRKGPKTVKSAGSPAVRNSSSPESPQSKTSKQNRPSNPIVRMSLKRSSLADQNRRTLMEVAHNKKKHGARKVKSSRNQDDLDATVESFAPEGDYQKVRKKGKRLSVDDDLKIKHDLLNNVKDTDENLASDHEKKKARDKVKYRNDDYAHDKIKNRKGPNGLDLETHSTEDVDMTSGKDQDRYFEKKRPHGIEDRRKRSSFMSIPEQLKRREEDGKENDAPKESMVNGDVKAGETPSKVQRPTSAKGSRRRMEDECLSSDEETGQKIEDDDTPTQPAGRLARPSSARPAPPKRKEDTVQQEPAMRLGSGKPQNLILDDGKDSDEDETFIVEEAAAPPPELEQPAPQAGDDDDEDHGGLVKKIMETKKEYEQPRENKIERPTISDAQRRKQREAVQKEIDKLRSSIQTLTRSANPLGKIMDYVQEDLDSMQKELEKWKQENKEHSLALKREKAITERAVEPLKAQLSEVDQAIKDQLDLIGAVKSNIIRNDQKMEKMLRTIAKS